MTNTIGFPGLGLKFTVNRVAFTIFSKPVYWYALIILSGFLLAVLFVYKTCKKRGVDPENIFDIAFYGLISGIVSARIYYCIFDPDCLKGNILNIVKIWEGGIAIYGGIIGAVISTLIYCRKKKLSVLNTFDVCTPGLLIGQAIGRWGNFVNAEAFGGYCGYPWGMSINSDFPVHPTFLYESLWNFLGFIILSRLHKKRPFYGYTFFTYLSWYGVGRFFIEGLRTDSLYIAGMRISQIVALLCVIGGAFALSVLSEKSRNCINKE